MSPSTPPAAGAAQPQYTEEPVAYPFLITLAGSQHLGRIPVPIDRDADFFWTGLNGSKTGSYTLNIVLPSGRYIASSEIQDVNLVSPAANQPTSIGPPPIYRAGSNGPMLDLTDTSTESNIIEIVFTGIRRVRTA